LPASLIKVLPNQCEVCGNATDLEIHYDSSLSRLFNEKENLQVLCKICHLKAPLQLPSSVTFDFLGHKGVLNTQLYLNLEEAIFEFNDQYEVKLASTVEEAVKLVEVGFEYITEMDGKKLFRKRK
jgi:hypothetical protein